MGLLSSLILPLLAQLAVRLPVIAALAVGIILALTNRPRLGRAATFALVGFSILLIELVLGTMITLFVPIYSMQSGRSASQLGVILGVIGIFTSFVTAAAWGFILAAIFARR